MKGPTDYSPASNSYPVKTLPRDVVMHLGLQGYTVSRDYTYNHPSNQELNLEHDIWARGKPDLRWQIYKVGDPRSIVNLIFNLYLQYGTDNTFIWIDGSNRAFCNLLKVTFNESISWEKSITKPSPDSMKVIPCNFSTEHKQMLSHLAMLVSKSYPAIPKEFDKKTQPFLLDPLMVL